MTHTPNNRLFDLTAPAWDRLMGGWGVRRVLEALALDEEPQGSVLDLGGGTGRLADRLERSPRNLVVVDLSRPMALRARRKGHESLQARAEALPLASASQARVLILDALHHMADRQSVLEECARVLVPGGRLVLFEPDPEHWFGKVVRVGERLARMGSRFAAGEELCAMARACALSPSLSRRRGHVLLCGTKGQSSSTKAAG